MTGLVQKAFLRRRSLLFTLVALIIAGSVYAAYVPVALFPQVNFPRIVVSLEAGDRPASQMVTLVTRPAETALRSVIGVRSLRSTSSRGSAEISVNFPWGHPMDLAATEVGAAVAQLLPSLPAGTAFKVRRMDPTVFPVVAMSFISPSIGPVDLRNIVELTIAPALSAIPGVGRTSVIGGALREYQVEIDPMRLRTYGLAIGDVTAALTAANILQATGKLEEDYKLYLVLSDERFRDLDAIRRTVLRTGAIGIVELDDVATVKESVIPNWTRVSADGREAVSLQVFQQPDGNTVQIVADLKAKLGDLKTLVPPGVTQSVWYDQSELIVASATSVRDAILIGSVLAALVLLVFLRSFRVTMIAAIIVPSVMAITTLILGVLGQSFNIMTLGGLAAAIGLIIDDVIVVLEFIETQLTGATNAERENSAAVAANDFLKPLLGSSLATLIIFLPLAFLTGVTGAFFAALSLTIAVALTISFILSWLVVPLLAAWLLRPGDVAREEAHESRWEGIWARSVSTAQRWPRAVVASILPLVAAGYFVATNLGSGFLPPMDEGGFVLDYKTPPGTSLTETDRLLQQVETILRATREVATYSRRTGAALGGGLTEPNEGDFFVRLKPPPRKAIHTIIADIRTQIDNEVPGIKVEMALLMEDLIGDLTAVPQPIEVKLYGSESTLLEVAPKVARAVASLAGLVEVQNGVNPAGDALLVRIDHVKAGLQGIDPAVATAQLNAMIAGEISTTIDEGERTIGVRVITRPSVRDYIARIGSLELKSADGHMVPLRKIAAITRDSGQPQIVRENLQPMRAVTARIEGTDLGSAAAAVTAKLSEAGVLPPSIRFELGGLYAEQQKAFYGLMLVIAAAFGLVLLLLLILFEDFAIAGSILLMPMLAACGSMLALAATGSELNISAIMGLTMVIGIVTEVAIIYFTAFEEFRAAGAPIDEALAQASRTRARPIVMTTLAAILALLPLALALGQGAEMQQPLAIAIIGGLILQAPLVLFVLPAINLLVGRSQPKSI